MTELYIDHQPVVLPEKFSIGITIENPFFTKNGKYTYDIELSLRHEENAKLYKHLNRLNSVSAVQPNRSAYLAVDNKVLLNGTEIILEISEKTVKIQLVSGESELNFIIGGDKNLNSLDLGTFNVQSAEEQTFIIPVYSLNENKIYNEYGIVEYKNGDSNDGIYVRGVKSPLIQPGLPFILKRIITSLGYDIQNNAFESGFLQYIRILNGRKTLKYSRMLPEWTVTEFFTELENLFNIAFIVDEYTKKVSVFFKADYYQNTAKTFVDEILDEYIQTIDGENKLSYLQSNIGYELTGDEYFKYQKLEKMIVERAEKTTLPDYSFILLFMNRETDTKRLKNKIYESSSSKTQYIAVINEGELAANPKKVNIFRDIMNNPDNSELDISFKIIPAPVRIAPIGVDVISQNLINFPYYMLAPLPATETDEGDDLNYILPDNNGEDYIDIQSILEGNSDTESQSGSGSSDRLLIFFYNGRHNIFCANYNALTNSKKVLYPIGFVDYLCEDEQLGEQYIDGSRLSLRLDSDYGLKPLYEAIPVDTTKEYTFKFISKQNIDVKTIFGINNKQFVCKEIKQTVTEKGLDELIVGIFYPVD